MRVLHLLFAVCLVSFTACQSKAGLSALRLKLLIETQQRTNNQVLKEEDNILMGIGAAVESGRYQPREVAVLERAELILKQTKALVNRLRETQSALLLHVRKGKNEWASNEHEPVASIVLNSRAATSADSLFQHLSSFVKFIEPLDLQPVKSLWLVADDTALISASQIFATPESYRQFYFEDATVIEALAVLSQQEAEVLRLSTSVLTDQRRLVGGSMGYYKTYAYAVAESNTVQIGEVYTADLLLVRETSGERALQMTANGKEVLVGKDGRGRVEFPVPQDLPPGQDIKRTFWEGTITMRVYGHDSTFRVRVPYTVRK